LRQGAQIVIGTPGRVMDHMNRGTLRLDKIKMVILDEADVMLNMGFREDIEFILQTTPSTRQTVFFSATMPRPIRDLIERHSKTPENVRIEQSAMTVPTVEQIYFEVDRRWKIEVLTRLIDVHDLKLGIIFCNTKRMVDDLVEHLNTQGYSAEGLHGDMNQAQRDRVMNKFRKSGLEFLVATDVAARGIDVDDIQVVFNYDLPYDVEDYVHRIGRTGRAGRSGMAFSFVAGRELFQIRNIERFTKMRIQRGRVPSVEEVDVARANVLLDKVRATLQGGEFQRQDHAVERLLEEGFDSTDIISAMLHLLEGGDPGAKQAPAKPDDRARPATRPASARPVLALAPTDRAIRPVTPPAPKVHTPAPLPVAEKMIKLAVSPSPAPDAVAPAAPTVPTQPILPQQADPAPAIVPPAAEPASAQMIPAAAPGQPQVESRAGEEVPAAPVAAQPSIPAARPFPKGFVPKKALRTELDRPAARQPVRRDYDQYEDQPGERPGYDGPAPAPAPRRPASRSTPAEMTRLWMSVGEQHGVAPGDVVGCILGETGLPPQTVGVVDIRERHTFVDVSADSARAIISKLNRTAIRGQRLKVKLA
ncbi:MAG: helicase-related protein, partial [Limisphaerales bacterium]